jgi:hypothetical protein
MVCPFWLMFTLIGADGKDSNNWPSRNEPLGTEYRNSSSDRSLKKTGIVNDIKHFLKQSLNV